MLKFDYARNSFRYIIKKYKIKEIYIPYYLCEVMRHSAFDEKCKPIFYHIDDNFMPENKFPIDSFILYPNYFGICDKNVEKLVNIYSKIIIDNAHAFYAQPSGFASFNSARKFLSGRNVSNLWIGKGNNSQKPDILRRKTFDEYHIKYSLQNQLTISLNEDSIPFCYPFLAKTEEQANALVKELSSAGFTIYRYWQSMPISYNEYKFYSRLVPIPLVY